MGIQWSSELSRMMKSIFVACAVAVAYVEATGDAFNGGFHAYSFAGNSPYPHPFGPRVFKRSAEADSDSYMGYVYTDGYNMDAFGYNGNFGYAAPFGFHSMGKRSSDSDSEVENYGSNSNNNNNNAPLTFTDFAVAPAAPFAHPPPQAFDFAPPPRPFGYSAFPPPAPFNPGMRAYGFGK